MKAYACRLLLILSLSVLAGCISVAQSQIVPLTNLRTPTLANKSTLTPELRFVTLPTPQIQNAAQGYYQDDTGLRLAIAGISAQAIPQPDQDEHGFQYLVLTLTLTNYSEQTKDATGFPFTVWLRDVTTNEEYAPELYAPSKNNMWQEIDKLNKGTVKHLGKNQTLRGELFFQVPSSADKFALIWQPSARRRWILTVPRLR